jgi:hypothetical protein
MIVPEQLVILILLVNVDVQNCYFRKKDPDMGLVVHESEIL